MSGSGGIVMFDLASSMYSLMVTILRWGSDSRNVLMYEEDLKLPRRR